MKYFYVLLIAFICIGACQQNKTVVLTPSPIQYPAISTIPPLTISSKTLAVTAFRYVGPTADGVGMSALKNDYNMYEQDVFIPTKPKQATFLIDEVEETVVCE